MLRPVLLNTRKLPTRPLWLSGIQVKPATALLGRQLSAGMPLPLQLRPRRISTSSRRYQDVFHSQLEDPSSAAIFSSLQKSPFVPQTLTEKIVQRYSLGLPENKHVRAGDYVTMSPHCLMTHDNSWPVALKFMSIGASKIHDPHQVVMTLDHDVQNKTESNLKKYRQIEEFAREHKVDFYPAGRGIGHQIMVEEGYAWPGTLVVASDSHSNMYGGVGCLGTPVVRTDAASIWATGQTWWQIPPVAKINFTGTLPVGVTGKDVIIALCGLFNNDEVLNHAIEFSGSEETLRSLPVDDRLTIANMTTEWGALTGLFPIDSVLKSWLRYKATESALHRASELSSRTTHQRLNHPRLEDLFSNPLSADKGAEYAKEYFLDLSTLSPYVSGPNSVKIATPLDELSRQDIRVDKAYLVSCTNSRASDLAAAAKVFRDAAGKNGEVVPKIAEGVEFYIAAASLPEEQAAQAAGDWQIMLEAGAKPLISGCGPCIGLGTGLLKEGEVGISASNRNFKGRMGSRDAKAYLASPEVVAASALSGHITGPGWYNRPEGWSRIVMGEEGDADKNADRMVTTEGALESVLSQMENMIKKADIDFHNNSESQLTDIFPGFAEKIEGEIVFCDADNINTDAIYPGKFTYQDGVTAEQMAKICMSNYDTTFSTVAQAGDILVAGFNFGCGSSREQAATAILAKKIPLVVAGSFGNIFSRNSINNALMGVEIPRLVQRLREEFTEPRAQKAQKGTREPSRNGPSSVSSSVQGAQQEVPKPSPSAPKSYKETTGLSPSTQEVLQVTETSKNSDSLDSPPPAPLILSKKEKPLTRRTGWKLAWDVRRSTVEVKEGEGGPVWSQKVVQIPPNVQEIIARGGLEKWVKKEIEASP